MGGECLRYEKTHSPWTTIGHPFEAVCTLARISVVPKRPDRAPRRCLMRGRTSPSSSSWRFPRIRCTNDTNSESISDQGCITGRHDRQDKKGGIMSTQGLIRTAQSNVTDARQAAQEFYAGVQQADMSLVVFFCSSRYDLD